MAKTKTKSSKKSAVRKTAPGKKPAALSASAKRSLLRPRTGAVDLAFTIATSWKSERSLRVDALTPAKLRSSALKARKAGDRRRKVEEKHARQLQPVADAQLIAEDLLWRRLLALRAAIALRARTDPTVEARFSPLIDALKKRAAARKAPQAPAVPPPPQPKAAP